MPHSARGFVFPPPNPRTLWLSAVFAISAHIGVLLFWKIGSSSVVGVGGDVVEVTLVESSLSLGEPGPVSSEVFIQTAEPQIAMPESPPSPRLEPEPPVPSEMAVPQVVTAPSSVPVAATPKPKVSRPKLIFPPGAKTTTSEVRTKTTTRNLGKPVFLAPPSPAYPKESRASGERGVVVLRITANADGRPIAVSVAKSSGFPRLDRAAVEGGWRCRIRNAIAGVQFEAPVRFDLQN